VGHHFLDPQQPPKVRPFYRNERATPLGDALTPTRRDADNADSDLEPVASRVCSIDLSSDARETRLTMGSTTQCSATGIWRLRAIASVSMYTPPSRSS
jgi:hypothetical protein